MKEMSLQSALKIKQIVQLELAVLQQLSVQNSPAPFIFSIRGSNSLCNNKCFLNFFNLKCLQSPHFFKKITLFAILKFIKTNQTPPNCESLEDDLISKNKKSIIFLCSNDVLNKLNEDFNITINEPNVKTAINRQKDENYLSARSFSKPTLPKGFLSK